jgi:hypothetical protein
MKNKLTLILCVLLILGSIGTVFAQTNPQVTNLVKNGDFEKYAKEWPNWPNDWRITWKGGDGYEPVKTEVKAPDTNRRFIGWAEHTYNFTLSQNITGLTAGKYTLAADFRLNPDSELKDIVMSVYSGTTLLKSKSVLAELLAAKRETDIRFELTDIQVTGAVVRIEFTGTNILKYIGIDNVVFFK